MLNLCNICGAKTQAFSNGLVLNKYTVTFYRCPHCGFMQTEKPYWLNEAYSEPINKSDTGYIARNISTSHRTAAIINSFYKKSGRFLDYGGGYGTFVRLMRDKGFDYYLKDKFCENIFARGFECPKKTTDKFELLTAFEVFEHLSDPIQEVKTMLSYADNILFSTWLIDDSPPPLEEWWYYGLHHGQHISFFTLSSLKIMAAAVGLNLTTNGSDIHMLSLRNISNIAFRFIMSNRPIIKLANLLTNHILRRQSLTDADHVKCEEENV